jgi:hypothetical protein
MLDYAAIKYGQKIIAWSCGDGKKIKEGTMEVALHSSCKFPEQG